MGGEKRDAVSWRKINGRTKKKRGKRSRWNIYKITAIGVDFLFFLNVFPLFHFLRRTRAGRGREREHAPQNPRVARSKHLPLLPNCLRYRPSPDSWLWWKIFETTDIETKIWRLWFIPSNPISRIRLPQFCRSAAAATHEPKRLWTVNDWNSCSIETKMNARGNRTKEK